MNVTSENGISDGVAVEAEAGEASAEIQGKIVSDGNGVVIENYGGTATVVTGEIEAAAAGISQYYDYYNDADIHAASRAGETSSTLTPPPSGTTEVQVNGDITIKATDPEANAAGIWIGLPAGSAEITVDGDLSVTAPGRDEGGTYAAGVDLMTAINAEAEATVTGDVQIIGMDTVGVNVWAGTWADWADSRSTTAEVLIEGDIDASGSYATGICADAGLKDTAAVTALGSISVSGDEFAAGIMTDNQGGTVQIQVAGDITSSQDGMILKDNPREDTGIGGEKVSDPGGKTVVEVLGDVTAGETGIDVDLTNKDAAMDVIVDGTVTGEKHGVLVSEETVTDNLTVTVWQIVPNDEGNLAERVTETDEQDEITATEADKELEKKIQYIIRIAETDQDKVKTTGTRQYQGYDVANEGDTVTLKVEIPEGYQLAGAFNGTGDKKVTLLKDSNGDYYLAVPRGGGVLLSVQLEKIPEPEPQPEPEPEPVPEPVPDPEPVPEPEPDPEPEPEPEPEDEPVPAPAPVPEPAKKTAVIEEAEETAETSELKKQIEDAVKAGNVLNALPEEIKAKVSGATAKAAETLTQTLENYEADMGAVILTIAPATLCAEGEKVTVLIALPKGNGEFDWFAVEGIGQADGTLNLNLPGDIAKLLANKTFVTLIIK